MLAADSARSSASPASEASSKAVDESEYRASMDAKRLIVLSSWDLSLRMALAFPPSLQRFESWL